jgi:flagellar biosynthesis protein
MPARPPRPPRPPRRRAAALRYEPERDRAPRLVARGDGHVASRIVEIAREHGIPIHEDRALVDLLARLDVGTEIPPELYRVVAEIIAFVYRLQATMAGTPAPGAENPDASVR